MLRNTVRTFSTSSKRFAPPVARFKGPTPLRPKSIPYDPKVFSVEEEVTYNKRPIPVNVEANYWRAIRHKPKYGEKVAEIQLRSYEPRSIEFFGDFIIRAAYYLNIPVSGVTPLPARNELWTVIKAPFVHAKTKENYQRTTHKRLIKAFDATPEVIDLWISFLRKHSAIGVGIKVQTYQRHSLDFTDELDQQIDTNEIDNTISYDALSENSEVKKRVEELLNDPVFKQHLNKNDDKNIKQEIKNEKKK